MTLLPPKSTFWLPDDEWHRVQKSLPITCVDVLPVQLRQGKVAGVGLILRHTPHQGPRWCLIGGRLQYTELLTDAVYRELFETLGGKLKFKLLGLGAPDKVVQYLPEPDSTEYYDPRQHAISLTFIAEVSGELDPQGEALDFNWFTIDQVCKLDDEIGFGQQSLIIDLLERVNK